MTKETYLNNIQYFIDRYDKSTNLGTTLLVSSEFAGNKDVFTSKAGLPDLVLKTRVPFDKSVCFWMKRRKVRYSDYSTPSNVFPSQPILYPPKSEKTSSSEILPSDLDDGLRKDLLNKTWYISMAKSSQYIYYGPITTKRVYIFLKNLYVNLPTDNEKKNFLVVDCERDIHFNPDTLYEILSEVIQKKDAEDEESLFFKRLEVKKVATATKTSTKTAHRKIRPSSYYEDKSYGSNSTNASSGDDFFKGVNKKARRKYQSKLNSCWKSI
jgi:hypothetical protein